MNKISSDQNPSTVLLSVISKCNSSDIDNIPQTSNWAFGANHDCGNPIYGRIQPLWRQAFTHMNSLRKFIPREPSVTTGVVITVTRQRDTISTTYPSTRAQTKSIWTWLLASQVQSSQVLVLTSPTKIGLSPFAHWAPPWCASAMGARCRRCPHTAPHSLHRSVCPGAPCTPAWVDQPNPLIKPTPYNVHWAYNNNNIIIIMHNIPT